MVGSQTFSINSRNLRVFVNWKSLYLLTLSRLGVFGRKEFGSGGGRGGGAERAQTQRIDFQSLIGGSLQKARL